LDQYSTDAGKLFELVTGIQIRSRRIIETGLRAHDLTFAQFSALLALSSKSGMSQAELAQALDTDSTTAMVLRTSLEKKKLVARVDDPADGRVKRIEITDSGKSTLQSSLPEAKGLYAKAGAQLSDADIKRLLPALEKLYAYLGEVSAPRKSESAKAPKAKASPMKAPKAPKAEAKAKGAPKAKAGRPAKASAPKAKATKVKVAAPKAKAAAPKAKPAPKAKAKAPAKKAK
jgi:DNA-binding MarR family transcriptional regulator